MRRQSSRHATTIALALSACTISAPEPQTFTGNGITVSESGEISLNSNVVQTAAKCANGQMLVQMNSEWRCQDVPSSQTSTGTDTTPPPVVLNDTTIPDDLSINNGILTARANGEAVGVGTDNPAEDAVLDVTSDSKGLLLPRLSTAQRTAIVSPTAGLIVFDSDATALMIYSGTEWVRLGAKSVNCPPGYTWNDSRNDVIICGKGSDEMVKLGDFWVDRYESVVKESLDCSGMSYGTTEDDFPPTFPDNGQVTTATAALYACSIRQTLPSRYVTWFQAQQACVSAGKHLITNAEWQAAASGTVDPESTGSQTNSICNTFGGAIRVTGGAGTVPASSSSCISRFGVEDIIGNAAEWTGDWTTGGLHWSTVDGQRTQWAEAASNFDGTRGVNGRGLGSSGTYTNGVPSAVRRGGAWDDGTRSGVFNYRIDSGPFYSNSGLGFRCARR